MIKLRKRNGHNGHLIKESKQSTEYLDLILMTTFQENSNSWCGPGDIWFAVAIEQSASVPKAGGDTVYC